MKYCDGPRCENIFIKGAEPDMVKGNMFATNIPEHSRDVQDIKPTVIMNKHYGLGFTQAEGED